MNEGGGGTYFGGEFKLPRKASVLTPRKQAVDILTTCIKETVGERWEV